ncbi:MAG: branched-chain amino acid ABC transporter substrate-binding protein, partial [Pseudomonadota bacterium]|nr:branched-chain amino acid ABC transporter substrate-binding protein [Pseudomonadota bacterium]
DMRFTNMSGEELWMRGEDHQIIQPLHISVHTDQNIVVDADNSGFGLYRDFSVAGDETVVDHSCRMRRPRR